MLQPLAMLLATSLSQVPDAPKKINLRAFLAGDKMRVKVWRPDNFASFAAADLYLQARRGSAGGREAAPDKRKR